MTRLPVIIGAVAVILLLVYSSIFIVTPTQQAIVLRFGEITRVESKPGLYFKLPTRFVDSVQFVDNRLLRLDLNNLRVQVRDGRRYVVDAFIAFRIVDPRKFRQNVSGNLNLLEAICARVSMPRCAAFTASAPSRTPCRKSVCR